MPQPPERSLSGQARHTIGVPIIELQSVDSTNNYARKLLNEGLTQHGTAYFAYEQVAGKGRLAKVWESEKGSNILLSIVIDPTPLKLSDQFKLIVAVALSAHQLIVGYAGDQAKIKWPNDIYWQDRKAGGILIESVVRGSSPALNQEKLNDWPWAIVGIGLNINQRVFPSHLSRAISLQQITGNSFNPLELARELCAIFDDYFERLKSEGFDSLYSQYLQHLYKKNEKVKLKKGSRVFEAVVKGVSESGQLITHHAIEEAFEFGQIEWVS